MHPSLTCLRTERLILVAATAELVRLELDDPLELWDRFEAQPPGEWPPPLNDEASQRWMLDLLTSHPDAVGWGMWYFLFKGASRMLYVVGNGGFTGPPREGTVEVGYSVLEIWQRRGFAPEAVGALLAHAFSSPAVDRVIAHTLEDGRPSHSVLLKCGFQAAGAGPDPGTLRFELGRGSFQGRAGALS